MSLAFQAEAQDEQFLAELLALLDVEEEVWLTPLTPDEPLEELPKPKLKRLRPHPNSGAEIKPKRRRRGVATPRLRNKANIELLRHEVSGLEALLASLQHSRREAAVLASSQADSRWKVIAMRQSCERAHAESLNSGLKRMLAQQYMLTQSLTHVLNQWREQPGPAPSFSASACV
jgi:hypothetical protein